MATLDLARTSHLTVRCAARLQCSQKKTFENGACFLPRFSAVAVLFSKKARIDDGQSHQGRDIDTFKAAIHELEQHHKRCRESGRLSDFLHEFAVFVE